MRARRAAAVLLLALAGSALAFEPAPPPTRVESVVETLQGTTVSDPYRWLEDLRSPATRRWFEAQDAHARRVLDGLPDRAALRERLAALTAGDERVRDLQWAGDRLFYLKRTAGDEQYRLCMRDGVAGAERVLVDPARLHDGGKVASIDFFRASPNGQRVAYGVSYDGTEDATLHVIETSTLRPAGPPIRGARFAAPSWRFDSDILFYTQQRELAPGAAPLDALRGSRAYQRTFQADGAVRDVAVLGIGVTPAVALAPDDVPSVYSSPISPFVIGVIQHGVRHEVSLYVARLTDLRGAQTPWRRLAGPERGIVDFDLRGEWIYVVTHENAPRYRVLRWSLGENGPFNPATAGVVLPESRRVVRGIGIAKDSLYVQQSEDGDGRLLRLPFNPAPKKPAPATGRRPAKAKPAPPSGEVPLPWPAAIEDLATNPLSAGALVRLASWTEAPAYFVVDPRANAMVRAPLTAPPRGEFRDVTVTRAQVTSHDGVAVPVSLVHRRAIARDGSARVLLEAYGAYGVSSDPRYAPALLAWLERGGVLAVAHVRGGGELGDGWHRAGFKSTKANSWRDVLAVAQWLVQERWTAPARLAVTGASAGAIATGRAVVERPDLFAAFVSVAGFHDTLRSEAGLAGPANVAEFGSVADADGVRDLLAMSTYASLRDGVAYPAALLTTGLNDPRVDAWDPGKAAARLQAISEGPGGSGKPVLLRVDVAGGHERATASARLDEYADVLAFLLWQTGAGEAPRTGSAAPGALPATASPPD